MEKKCKKAKWLSDAALQIAVKRREAKSKGEKERYPHLNAEFQRIARRDKKAFLSDHITTQIQKKIIHDQNFEYTIQKNLPRSGFNLSFQPYLSLLPLNYHNTLQLRAILPSREHLA